MINILDFGAVGDGKTLNTIAIKNAVTAAKAQNTYVFVPCGTYLSGTINLDGVSLYLDHNATLLASSNPKDYPNMPYVHNEMGVLTAFIVCLGGKNVFIKGHGTIDLNARSFFDFSRPIIPPTLVPMNEAQIKECTVMRDWRPNQSVFMYEIDGLTIKGVKILDAPCWSVSIVKCRNVIMRELDIRTDLNIPNNDGIHVSASTGVIIENCHIESGDDCIALSCITDWDKTCQDITISNCVLKSMSKAIVIGYQYSHVRRVTITNCVIKESNRGLCFMCNKDGGLVEDVIINGLIIDTVIRAGNWWGNGEPLFMEANISDGIIPKEQKSNRITPKNYKNIIIKNLVCAGENALGIIGTGNNCSNVFVSDVILNLKTSKNICLKGKAFDCAPAPNNVFLPDSCGFLIKDAGDVRTNNIALFDPNGNTLSTVIQ